MKTSGFTFLFVCFIFSLLPAQNKYYLQSYNNVLDVKVSGDDLWAGTTKGLVQFNKNTGEICGIYNASNSPIPSDNVFDVEVDPAGDVWLATQEGLFRFNGFGFQLIENGLYIGIGFDDVGNRYASTKLEYEFCNVSYALSMFQNQEGYISSVAYNDDGYCYTHKNRVLCGGGGSGGGCWESNFKDEIVTNGEFTEVDSIDFKNILLIDSIGNFWSTLDKLSYIDPNTAVIETPQTDTLVADPTMPWLLKFNAAAQDSTGRIWLASTLGVFRFDGQSFVKYNEGLLGSQSINSIDIDEAGTVFIGSKIGGVYRLNSDDVWEPWLVDGLISNSVNMSSNTADKYAFGSNTGLSIWENGLITTHTAVNSILPRSLPFCKVYVDESNGVWVNANDSIEEVYYLSDASWMLFDLNNSDLLSDDFTFIESNDSSEVWLRYGSPSIGAAGARFQNGTFTNFVSMDSLYENTGLLENKWTIEGYAAVKNEDGVITSYPIPESMFDSTCVSGAAISANGIGIMLIDNWQCGESLGKALLRFNGTEWLLLGGSSFPTSSFGQIEFRGDDIYISITPELYNCDPAHYKILKPNNQYETYYLPEPGTLSPNYGPVRDGYVYTTLDGAGDLWAYYVSYYGDLCWGPNTGPVSSRVQLFKKTAAGFVRYAGPYCAGNYARSMNTMKLDGNGRMWIQGALGIYSTEPIAPMLAVFEKESDCAASAVACVIGGLQNEYQFEWSDGNTNPLRFSMDAGSFSCTATDANGATDEVAIVLNTGDAIAVESSFIYESTSGFSDASISIDTVIGAYPPFDYLWNTGDITTQIDSLSPAVYEVTITDQIGCTNVLLFSLYEEMLLTFTQTNIFCNGDDEGTIELMIAGGLPPYDIDWAGSNSTSLTRDNLSPGEYSVTITDNSIFLEELTIIITEPEILNLSTIIDINPDNVTGSIFPNVVGGTAPYSYLWNTGSIDTSLVDQALGSYSLLITDAEGCVAFKNILLAYPIEISGEVNSLNCDSDTIGFIDLSVVGGVPPYDYDWNTGDTTSVISGLSQGNYYVTVTDSIGYSKWECFSFDGMYSLVYGIELQAEITPGLVEVLLDFNTGSPPYDIVWSTGDTTEILSGVEPGFYSVSITDANGCNESAEAWLYYPISVESVSTGSLCEGGSSGTIEVTVTGGIPPYSYDWSFTNLDTSFVDNLSTGSYNVAISDSYQETESVSFFIAIIPFDGILGLNTSFLELTILEEGELPYSYEWNTGDTTELLEVIDNGFYFVTVTDASACTFEADYLVTTVDTNEPEKQSTIKVFPNPTNALLHVQCKTCQEFELVSVDGKQIKANVEVGRGGIYELDMAGLPAGIYFLKIFDKNHELLKVERVLLFQ